MLSLIVERALRGEASPRADLDFLEDSPALDELVEAAHLVTTKCASRVFNFCTIVNAKSGRLPLVFAILKMDHECPRLSHRARNTRRIRRRAGPRTRHPQALLRDLGQKALRTGAA